MSCELSQSGVGPVRGQASQDFKPVRGQSSQVHNKPVRSGISQSGLNWLMERGSGDVRAQRDEEKHVLGVKPVMSGISQSGT